MAMEMSFKFLLLLCSLCLLFPFCSTLPQGFQSDPAQCSSFESSGYFCVPYFLCNDTGTIIVDGGGIFDPRASDPVNDDVEVFLHHEEILKSKCDGLIQVCCKHPYLGTPINDFENLEIATVPRVVNRPKEQVERSKPKCGKRNRGGLVEEPLPFSGGQLEKGKSRFGEWPHVCAVLKEEFADNGEKINRYLCVGSLISKEVVLTAAHCVKKEFESNVKLRVRCGDWDISNEDEIYPHQERDIVDIIIHPDHVEKNLHYNFALLITEDDFELGEHISPVCLPSTGDNLNLQDCVSHGWGKDEFGSKGKYQKKLKEIQLPLVGHQECERRLRETRLGRYFKLDDSFMCAGGEPDMDTCSGDGGGPLTCRHGKSGPWVQAGIVSWGIGCGDDVPAVYANVAKVGCWIDRVVSCYLAPVGNSRTQSVFGFEPEDCPGKLAIGDCTNALQRGF